MSQEKLLQIRDEILQKVSEYGALKYQHQSFKPEESVVAVSGKVLDENELKFMVDASLDGWLTTGRFNEEFEKKLANFLGVKYLLTTNSGSSADLSAFSALTSDQLGDRAIQPGDEVITVGVTSSLKESIEKAPVGLLTATELKSTSCSQKSHHIGS